VGNQVSDQVSDQVWSQVRSQVGNQVGSQVSDQVSDQVGSQVESQVGSQKLKYESFAYNDLSGDAGWVSFYDYFREIKIVNNQNFEKYIKFIQSGVFMSLNLNGCVIACKCPSFVNFDEQGRFHSVESKAIQWADGWGVYCVNGISFDEDKFKKFFIEKNYTNEDFQSVTNTEQKAVLIKHLGYEKVISLLKDYTEIDRYKGMSKVTNKPVEYVLF